MANKSVKYCGMWAAFWMATSVVGFWYLFATGDGVYAFPAVGCLIFSLSYMSDIKFDCVTTPPKESAPVIRETTETGSHFEVASCRGKCTYYGGTDGPPKPPPPPPPPDPPQGPSEWYQRSVTPQE